METQNQNTETVNDPGEGTEVDVQENMPTEKSEAEQIVDYLKENGSPKMLERLGTKEGQELCVSYIKANLEEAGGKVSVAAGWLEQTFED